MMNMMMINRRNVPGCRKGNNAGGGSEQQEGQQQPYQPHDEHLQTPARCEEEFSSAPVQENAPAKSYHSRNNATEGKNLTLPSSLRVCRGNVRHRRRASVDSSPALASAVCCKEGNRAPVPEKLTADDFTGKFAYISLDGRLINAELATSATSIGGGLGDKEAQAWEDFAPMQRVLIVAVSAAVAAAAKHKNSKEIKRLLKTVTDRENELIVMRQQLNELYKRSMADPGRLSSRDDHLNLRPEADPGRLASRDDHLNLRPEADWDPASPRTPVQRDRAMRRFHMDEEAHLEQEMQEMSSEILAQLSMKPLSRTDSELTLGDSLGDLTDDELGDSLHPPVNKDVVLVETPSRNSSQVRCRSEESPSRSVGWAKEGATWYVNPMVEMAEHYNDMCTPERGNPMFSTCTPANQGSDNLMPSRFAFTKRDSSDPTPRLLPLAPFPLSPVQAASDVKRQLSASPVPAQDESIHEKLTALRAQCAAVVLDFKKQALMALDKEVRKVMAAQNIGMEEARGQVQSMQSTVASCWQAMAPEAFAALGLAPSEFESYLRINAQEIRRGYEMAKTKEGIHTWRKYLGVHDDCSREAQEPENIIASKETPFPSSPADISSTNLLGLSGGARKVETNRLGIYGRHPSFGFPETSSEYLTEQLLKDLDNATAKKPEVINSLLEMHLKTSVVDMESQMIRLQQTVADDVMRRESESKRENNLERGFGNQVKVHTDFAALAIQLRPKDSEITELEKSRKPGIQTHQRKEIERKQEESNVMCSVEPRGYGRIYWERAASPGNLILHPDTSGSKRRKRCLMTESEPKVMLLIKNKELTDLRQGCNKRDAEFDMLSGAAQAIRTADANRIADLEDLCRRKDSIIVDLKQEILALEAKMHSFKTFQSPALLRGRRSFISIAPPMVNEYGVVINEHQHLPQKLNVFEDAPSPQPLEASKEISHGHLQGFQRGMLERRNQFMDYATADTPRLMQPLEASKEGHGHVQGLQPRGLLDSRNPFMDFATTDAPRFGEVMHDVRSVRGCDQESAKGFSSPPGSTIGDDLSELEQSLQTLSVNDEPLLENDHWSFSVDSKFQSPKDQVSVVQYATFGGVLPEQKNSTSGRALRSSTRSLPGLTRTRANVSNICATPSRAPSRQKTSSGYGSRVRSGEKKLRSDVRGSRNSLSSLKVLGTMAPNTTNHRRASSLELKVDNNTILGAGGSLDNDFKENSAIRRRRWV